MRRPIVKLLTLLALSWLISGCNGKSKTSSPELNKPLSPANVQTIELQGRRYIIETPTKGYDSNKAYKLLLAFHGSMQGAGSMRLMAQLERDAENYIIVYPQSKVEEWNEGCDCNKPNRLGIDDLGFVEDVVADVQNRHHILPEELYAVGFSQGGLFTQNLLCNSKLRFKAIASVASSMSVPLSQSCQIQHPTNYLLIQGKQDKVLAYGGTQPGNFALISSPDAVALLAQQNQIQTAADVVETEFLTTHTYQGEEVVTSMVAVENGGHSWHFNELDTNRVLLDFFASVSAMPLDSHSNIYPISVAGKEHFIHVRTMGEEHQGPAVILLSGFNKNYHADSAWFSLLQPMLAQTHRVHVIERSGNGFSSPVAEPSYTAFAPLLDQTLTKLDEETFVMVNFASSNILAQSWYQQATSVNKEALKGMVWIDPDILLPHSIEHYQGYPVDWYRKVAEQLLPHIEQGNWTEKTQGKLDAERAEHEQLIPTEVAGVMDWSYYELISSNRASIDKQLTRAKEIVNYHHDLDLMRQAQIATDVAISIIDTDFESSEIIAADPEYVAALEQWQKEGTAWSKEVSAKTQGQYLALENSVHMAVFQHPESIINVIKTMSEQE